MGETKGADKLKAKPDLALGDDCRAETTVESLGGEPQHRSERDPKQSTDQTSSAPRETGGRDGLDPTRYGDWEKAGRCIDF